MELFNLLAKLTLDTDEFSKDLDRAESDLKAVDVSDPKLGLDNEEFNDNIEESKSMGDTFGTEMEKVFNGIKTALTVTGIAATIGGIVRGLKEAVDMTAQTADGIDKGSKRLAISTDAYQQWDHALRQSGSSIDSVKKGLAQMRLVLKAADPATAFADAEDQVDGLADKAVGLSEDAKEAFRDLGLLGDITAGKFKNTEELMLATMKALAGKGEDERAILVTKLFGKGGDELNALLAEGGDGIDKLLAEAKDLGLIMTEDEISNAVAYGDAVANLQAELDAIRTAFVADIIPVLTSGVEWLTKLLSLFNPRLRENSLSETFKKADEELVTANTKLEETSATAQNLIQKLDGMGDYWTLDDKGKKTWTALAQEFVDTYPQFESAIDWENRKIRGNTDEINANIHAWMMREKQRLINENTEKKREAIAKKYADALDKEVQAEVKEADAQGKREEALKQINAELKRAGMTELGENATADEMRKAKTDLRVLAGEDTSEQQRINDLGSEYLSLTGEADKLRTEASKMYAEADEAQANLETYQAKLAEKLGITQEELNNARGLVDKFNIAISEIPRDVWTKFHVTTEEEGHPHAIGGVIPYDNYPALLHRGEKVLTATQVRRGEGSGGLDIGHLEDKIAAAVRNGMSGATVRSYINGRDITDEVNRNNIRDVKGRRFAT